MRVPILNVHWDQPGSISANRSYLEGLKYADRRSLVIDGLDHVGLVLNPLTITSASARHRDGYQYVVRAVYSTLMRAVGAPNDRFFDESPSAAGFKAVNPQGQLALRDFEAALTLLASNAELSLEQKELQARLWRAKVAACVLTVAPTDASHPAPASSTEVPVAKVA